MIPTPDRASVTSAGGTRTACRPGVVSGHGSDFQTAQPFDRQAEARRVCRLPSTTFPAGVGEKSGLPLGLNVVSAEYNDYICIDVARLLAKEAGFVFASPPGYGQSNSKL